MPNLFFAVFAKICQAGFFAFYWLEENQLLFVYLSNLMTSNQTEEK